MASAAEALIEHLHYGKLVTDEGLVPSSEGYAVTRRSRNLDAHDDVLLSLPALLDVRSFAPDLIDAPACQSVLVVRWLDAVNGRPERVAIIRARFRPEDGEGAPGRRHQQAAVWVASREDWIRQPLPLLRQAARMQAMPDRLREPRDTRIDIEPLRIALATGGDGQSGAPAVLSGDALRICDFIIQAAPSNDRRSLLFGGNDFKTEEQFLEAAGLALQHLPEEFENRQRVVISSGLRHTLDAVSIRYLKSVTSSNDAFDEDAARARVEAFSRRIRYGSDTRRTRYGSDTELLDKFKHRYRSYFGDYSRTPFDKWSPRSVQTARDFIHAGIGLREWWDREGESVDASLRKHLDEGQRGAFITIDMSCRTADPGGLPMGCLLDAAELFARARAPTDDAYYGRALHRIDAWLDELGVWLPEELDRLKTSAFLYDIMGDPPSKAKCAAAYARSFSLEGFVRQRSNARARQKQIETLKRFTGRLALPRPKLSKWSKLLARYAKIGDVQSLGIHRQYPIWLDAIVTPDVYISSIEGILSQVLVSFVPRL